MKTLTMTFVSEIGDKVNVGVTAVKETLTSAEVKTVMDTIIAKNVFTSAGGDLKAKYGAAVVERVTEKLDIIV